MQIPQRHRDHRPRLDRLPHVHSNNSSTWTWTVEDTCSLDGYLSAITETTSPDLRPRNLGWPPRGTEPIEDWANVGKGSFCFAGPFHIVTVDDDVDDEDSGATGSGSGSIPVVKEIKGLIVHGPMEVTSLPSFMGNIEVRNFTVTIREEARNPSGKRNGKGNMKGNEDQAGRDGTSKFAIELAWHLWLRDDGVDRADVYWRKIQQQVRDF